MTGPAVFRDNIDEYRKWFARLYEGRYTLNVHYKYVTELKQHAYYFEVDGQKKKTMPLWIPVMWFEDENALAALRENFLQRMQQKTFETLG